MTNSAIKPYKGLPMEGVVARWYARNTASDRSRFESVASAICQRVPPSGQILEVAPGPGYLAIELAKSGRKVAALDISKSFVEMVRRNADAAGVAVDARHGNASAVPFPAESFDYVVCMAAFKNFTEPVAAINEMHRILKPNGRASIYDLRKDAPPNEIDAEVAHMGLSTVSRVLTSWIFRYGLLRIAYTSQQMRRMAEQSRFGGCEIADAGIGFEARFTKQ
jgi:ubiquinone/menaquinone biosynthesis C-methylase UbiE